MGQLAPLDLDNIETRAKQCFATPGDALRLVEEVKRLRDGLIDLAGRAEDGASGIDTQARIADLLGVRLKWLRRECEERRE